jgi:hypothetical protein
LLFWTTSSFFWIPAQPLSCLDIQTPNNIVVVPGTEVEKNLLSNASLSWVTDNVRTTNGFFEYKLPLQSNVPYVLDFDSSGPCNLEISIGGELWNSVYSAGIEQGSPKDHIRRQILIEQPANNPMLARFSRVKGAGTPFYLLRFSVLRQLELYPGSASELSHLTDPGRSTLASGGGRLVPANSSISYNLSDSGTSTSYCIFEYEGEGKVLLDGATLDPIKTAGNLKLFKYELVKPDQSKISLAAINDCRLIRTSFYYSLLNIDPTSEFGKLLCSGSTELSGIKAEDGFEIDTLGNTGVISLNCSNPGSVVTESKLIASRRDFCWYENAGQPFKASGKGIIYSFSIDADSDNDKLPTSYEILTGTDPLFNDTDRDTIIDSADIFPLDKDNDGLCDSAESFVGSHMASFDSNSDGIADGLGLGGAAKVDMCERISDRINPGPKYLDVTDPKLLQTSRLFGYTSLVVPFRELLLSRSPESYLDQQIAKANGCYGILLDDCSIKKEYWSNDAFRDSFQMYAKRLWVDPTADNDMAFRLGKFSTSRVLELVKLAQTKAAPQNLKVSVSMPSQSDDSITTPIDIPGIDRVMLVVSDSDDSFAEGMKDAQVTGQPVYVHIPDDADPEHSRSYISGIMAAGTLRGTSSDEGNQLYVSRTIASDQVSFVQIISDSSYWAIKLDPVNDHPDWQKKLIELEMNARFCPVAKLGSAKTAFIDESTTFPGYEETQLLASWIKQGGALLVYEAKSRFSEQVWWGTRTTLGREIAKLCGIKEIETEKVMKAGLGFIMLTTVEPTSSIPRFFTDIIEPVPKPPCYYCPPGLQAVEAGFVSIKTVGKTELPKYPNPIYIPVEQDRFPYLVTSTCPVPWVGKSDSRISILAQPRKGQQCLMALGISGEPKAITGTDRFSTNFLDGILTITFVGTGYGDAFAIDTVETLDLKAINCVASPATVEEGNNFTIMATIQNVSKIPSSQFSVTFHVDNPSREKQIKRIVVDSLSPKQFRTISFEVPPMISPGDHRIFAVIVSDGELNLGNNTSVCDVTIKPKAKQRKIIMQVGNSKATIDGSEVQIGATPYITNGKTMVPFRFVAEALDAKVSWDQSEKMVTIVKGDVTVYLWIGKNYAIVSGNMVNLTSPPELKNGKTYVPLRFVSESLGAKVDWEPLARVITITLTLGQ